MRLGHDDDAPGPVADDAPGPVADDAGALAQAFGARAWLDMQRLNVFPTPKNFALWFAHAAGSDPAISQRLDALAAVDVPSGQRRRPSLATTDPSMTTCRDEPGLDLHGLIEGVEAIDAAVRTLAEQVAGGTDDLRRYGDTLTQCAQQLGPTATMETLAVAIATLTQETARTCQRNRSLEQQLAQSAQRIARLKDSLADVKREATVDPLTELMNRRAFDVRLRRALKQARIEAAAISVMMLDVDHFKRVNDTFGHHTGDLVLKLIGRLLNASIKGRDTAARYGGEEFAIIMSGADLRATATVADQIRATLAARPIVNKGSGKSIGTVTISVGVAQMQPGDTAATLLDRADVALYRAKHEGRNRVCTEVDEAVAA